MWERGRWKGNGTRNHQVGSQKLGAASCELARDDRPAAVEQWNYRRLILFSL